MSSTEYSHCDITYADGCIYEGFSYEDAKYCCNYVLDTEISDLQISQSQLFTQVTLVRNLNIASLISDYLFVILAGITAVALCKNSKEEARRRAVIITSIGSVVDIVLTFTIVGIINEYNLIDAFSDLYHRKCYSENIELTIIDFQDQFESILVLDALEGSLDILSLIILLIGWLKFRDDMKVAIGIHEFVFIFLDLSIITVNAIMFVIPTYDAFVEAYNDTNYLCFEAVNNDDTSVTSVTNVPITYTTEMGMYQISSTEASRNVTKLVETQWYESLSQSERVWMGVGFAFGGLIALFVCIPAICFFALQLCARGCEACNECGQNQQYSKVAVAK